MNGRNGLDLHTYYIPIGGEGLYFYLQSRKLRSIMGKIGHGIQENGIGFR